MTRGMALVIGLLVIVAALFAAASPRQNPYFDPALTQKVYPCSWPHPLKPKALDPFFEDWFSKPLQDVGEPSLFHNPPPGGRTTIRFTFLPAFVEPVIVRIDDLYGERPKLTAYRVVGQVRPGPDRNLQRGLTPEEADSIRDFIHSSRVLEEQPDSCLSDLDGFIFLIEANGRDGYRFINRWGVTDGSVYELGNRMFALTGWPSGRQGPDRNSMSRYGGPAPTDPAAAPPGTDPA